MTSRIGDGSGISDIRQRPLDPLEPRPQDQNNSTAGDVEINPSDTTQISPDAAEISRYRELVRLHREAYGDTDRSAKLEEVRRKLAHGAYDDPDTIDRMAQRMVEGTLQDAGPAGEASTIQRRIAEGYYDRPAVIDHTAENILKQIIPGQEVEE